LSLLILEAAGRAREATVPRHRTAIRASPMLQCGSPPVNVVVETATHSEGAVLPPCCRGSRLGGSARNRPDTPRLQVEDAGPHSSTRHPTPALLGRLGVCLSRGSALLAARRSRSTGHARSHPRANAGCPPYGLARSGTRPPWWPSARPCGQRPAA